MENSIKLALAPVTEDVAVKAFKLQLNSEFANNKIVVLVEGPTDKVFYGKFFNENVLLYKSEYGCGHFRYILDKLQDKYGTQFIILKDADFDVANSIDYSEYSNLFLTDYHDVEIMCAFICGEVEERISTKLLNVSEKGIFENVTNDISIVSFIKWYNCRASKKICTKELIGCYTTDKKLTIEKCLEKQQLKYGSSFNKDEIEKFISDNIQIDKRLITNGHDFCNALGKVLTDKRLELVRAGKQSFKNIGINEKCIQEELENIFSLSDFSQTNMYKSIFKWQQSNNCNILAI